MPVSVKNNEFTPNLAPADQEFDRAAYKAKRRMNYALQLELGAGYSKLGRVGDRKEPKENDEGGEGSGGMIPPHEFLSFAAQFAGLPPEENQVTSENTDPEVSERLELELKLQQQKQLQEQLGKNSAPTPSINPSR